MNPKESREEELMDDIAIEIDLMDALFFAGHPEDAYRYAGVVAENAAAVSERVAELCARIEEGIFNLYVEPEGAAEKLAGLVREAMPEFEASGDEFALYIGFVGLTQFAHMRGQMDAKLDAAEQAVVHAQRTGLPHLELWPRMQLGVGRLFGTTPVSQLLAWLDEREEQEMRYSWFRSHRAHSLAMIGRFDEARSMAAELRADQADRGARIGLALMKGHASVEVELLGGDPAAAVEYGREGCRLLEELGERSWLSTAAGMLAQALYALDRTEEAEAEAVRAAELGAQDDAMTQMLWRQVKAKVLARRGEWAEAERLAREAIAVGEETDMINAQGDAYGDFAEVLTLAGKRDEARAALGRALELFERKGNLVMAGRMQARLAELL